ncbi:hypothetical protein P7C70_g1659, partial [Phenoliferia sp. Uapishka_3]
MPTTTVTTEKLIQLGRGEPRSYEIAFNGMGPSSLVAGHWDLKHHGLGHFSFELHWTGVSEGVFVAALKVEVFVVAPAKLIDTFTWTNCQGFDGTSPTIVSLLGVLGSDNLKVRISPTFKDDPDQKTDDSDVEDEASLTPTATIAPNVALRSLDSPSSCDVRFRFHRNGTSAELWANAATLREASPYFESLLSSNFKEGRRVCILETPVANALPSKAGEDDLGEDSDVDDLPNQRSFAQTPPRHPVHQIDISSHSYATYRAVLCWIITSHIEFAPLTSTFSDVNKDAKVARKKWISDDFVKTAHHCIAVSPKSVYRLAHFLELPVLQAVALKAIKSNLRVENILIELIGDAATTFEEIREVELKFAAKHWSKIKEHQSAEALAESMDASSLEGMFWELAIRI